LAPHYDPVLQFGNKTWILIGLFALFLLD